MVVEKVSFESHGDTRLAVLETTVFFSQRVVLSLCLSEDEKERWCQIVENKNTKLIPPLIWFFLVFPIFDGRKDEIHKKYQKKNDG
jgi:hypothetical protein